MAVAETTTPQDGADPPSYHHLLRIFLARRAAVHAAHLIPYIKPHHHILDLGCGPGSITLDLARLVPHGRVVGVDLNEAWLVEARKLAEQQGVTNVDFQSGDAMHLDQFEPEMFDVVHAHQLLLHLPNPLAGLQEMRRVAKAGGIISSRDLAHQITIPQTPILERLLSNFDALLRSKGASTKFGTVSHISAHEAGFEWDKIQMSSWAWEYSGVEGRQAWADSVKDSFRAAGVQAGLATDEEMDNVREAWIEWGKNPESRMIGLDGAILCWK